MFAALYAAEGSPSDLLMAIAREFSPRVEVCGAREVTLDVSGLTRLVGDGRTIAAELRRTAGARGLLCMRVAIAGTRAAARLLVHDLAARAASAIRTPTSESRTPNPESQIPAEAIVIEPGTEAESLAPLPIDLLAIFDTLESRLPVLRQWGLRTLGDLATLPCAEVAARLGQAGVEWQRLARGDDRRPLVPAVPEERFEQALDLEWPIEGLEPLAFVLGRLLEPLSTQLERRDRGAAALHLRLYLVTRAVHERSVDLPAPTRDARALRTIALLDLESHPPAAAIDRVVVAVDPTPGRIVQFSLLTRPLPSPDQLSTLMMRLQALMGEGRCGAGVAVDSWEPGACVMGRFAPSDASTIQSDGSRRHGPQRHRDTETLISKRDDPVAVHEAATLPVVALRRFRHPMPVRVRVDRGAPVRVIADRRGWSGGRVETVAGPWRSSGGWWVETDDKARGATVRGCDGASDGAKDAKDAKESLSMATWERDEWDVTLSDGATYRIFRDRATEAWFIEGVVD